MEVVKQKITVEQLSMLEEVSQTVKEEVIRQLRKPVLQAFDIYKTNLFYGIISQTEDEKREILSWYSRLCDLDEKALEEIPLKIKKYL